MRIEDWRNLPASMVQPLYAEETRRWRLGLQWDLAPTLDAVEGARLAGTLPGFVLRGPGQTVAGWCYFVVQDGIVQIGSLLARTSDGVRMLLDATLRAPEASGAQDVIVFAFPESAAFESALGRRRFDITRQWFLRRTLDPGAVDASGDVPLRPLRDADGPDAVRLLARSYDGLSTARCFAPHGELDEWARYYAQVTRGTALGALVPEASFAACGPDGRLAALSLATTVSQGTLHLAQLAVDPSRRRHGLGARLLDATMAWGRAHRHPLMTLLVSDDNAPARQLYASRGFLPTGYFLYARRGPLRRSYPLTPAAELRLADYPR